MNGCCNWSGKRKQWPRPCCECCKAIDLSHVYLATVCSSTPFLHNALYRHLVRHILDENGMQTSLPEKQGSVIFLKAGINHKGIGR